MTHQYRNLGLYWTSGSAKLAAAGAARYGSSSSPRAGGRRREPCILTSASGNAEGLESVEKQR